MKHNSCISTVVFVVVLTSQVGSVTEQGKALPASPTLSAAATVNADDAPVLTATPQQTVASSNSWLVEFSGSSQWSKQDANNDEQEGIYTEGSAHVDCDASGVNCTARVSQIANYLRTSSTAECGGWSSDRESINVGQWRIYNDDKNYMILWFQNPDGSYNMALPFSLSRWYDVALLSNGFDSNCKPFSFFLTPVRGQDPWEPLVAHDPGPHVLTLTLPGGYFHVERTYLDNSFNPPALRSYQIRVIPLVNCANAIAPIQDGPGLTHYEIHLDTNSPHIRPDGAATFTARVTCGGVPVKGAQINFESQAAPNTGYHAHGDVLGPRPNGCLNGINIQDESIPEYTDDQGLAHITFQPGTNETCGTPRGIAGRYRITARSDRYPEIYDRKFIDVARHDLVPASETGNTIVCGVGSSFHTEQHAGTSATIGALAQIASDLLTRQVAENQIRVAGGRPAWPLQFTPIGDMSLINGGLLDANGDWSMPYLGHYSGSSIDFLPRCWAIAADQYEWLRSTLMSVGSLRGAWSMGELGGWPPAFHLEVFAAQQQQLAPTAPAPDLSAVILLSGPRERLVAAPGEVVTYTASIDNLNGTAAAHDVALTVTLPSGLNYMSANPAPTRLGGAGEPVWEAGTLLSGTLPQLYHVVAQVGAGVTPSMLLTVTAQATTSDADAHLANNQNNAGGLLIRPLGPDLAIHSSIGEVAMTVDRPVSFTIDVINFGTAIAPDASLTLTLPASVTLRSAAPVTASASAGDVVWLLGDIAPSDFKTVTATVEFDGALMNQIAFDPITTSGRLTYTVSVRSAVADIAPGDNTRQVVKPVELAGPDLAAWLDVEGSMTMGTIKAGQDLTYTINYGDWGNQVAHTTTLTLSLGSGLSVLSAQPVPPRTAASTVFSGTALGWDWGNLNVGDSGAVQVRVHVDSVPAEGSLVIASIQSADVDTRPMNNVDQDSRIAILQRVYLPIVLK